MPKQPTRKLPTEELQTPELPTPTLQKPELPAVRLPTEELQTPELPTPTLQIPELPAAKLPTKELQTPELPTPTLLQAPKLPAAKPLTEELQTPELPMAKVPETKLSEVELPMLELPALALPTAELSTSDLHVATLPSLDVQSLPPPQSELRPRESHPPVVGLPERLMSLDSYAKGHWIDLSGMPSNKPWLVDRSAFVAAVEQQIRRALTAEDYFQAELFVTALNDLGERNGLLATDIVACSALAANPNAPDAAVDPQRVLRLREVAADPSQEPCRPEALRVLIGLEALRPSLDQALNADEIDILLARGAFRLSPLHEVLGTLLRLAGQGTLALAELRSAIRVQSSLRTREQIQAELRQRRGDLWETYRRKAHAAGGMLRIRHCIEAWDHWLRQLSPLAQMLFPVEKGGKPTIDIASSQAALPQLAAAVSRIAESQDVWYDERKRFDREVQGLLAAVQATVDLAADLATQNNSSRSTPIARPISSSQLDSIAMRSCQDPYEELVRVLLLRALDRQSALAGATTEPSADFYVNRPRLKELKLVADGTLQQAAALIAAKGNSIASLPDRQHLCEIIVSVHLPKLRQLEIELDQVAAVTLSNHLRSIAAAAGQLVQSSPIDSPTEQLRLVPPWLEEVRAHGAGVLVRLKPIEVNSSVSCRPAFRTLLIRVAAVEQYQNPSAHLANLEHDLPVRQAKTQKDLLSAWRRGLSGDTGKRDQPIKTAFCTWALDCTYGNRTLYKAGRNEPKEFTLLTSDIIAWLAAAGHNPSFFPQLRQHDALVVMTAVATVGGHNMVPAIWGRASQFRRSMVAVLAPGIRATERRELLEYASQRDVTLAIVDDVDLLRLMNPEGSRRDSVLGLLEIILEQQPIRRITPFSAQDGQHVAIEMFVGRREEARELAVTAKYSRLFSGRKLGKSALLRYVTEMYDGERLPSLNMLRILDVSAVGVRYEQDMVFKILRRMEQKLGYLPLAAQSGKEDPAHRLAHSLADYLDSHPGESLLIFLDEADVFVEEQIQQYAQTRETCLSFRMRSEMMAQTDSRGLPRVRFVFAGYRVTDRSRGAWANWGQVLRLGPLSAEDAARLIGGPLGRLGIDAVAVADDIAFRCGYQPAVLHHFGQLLLERLIDRGSLFPGLVSDCFNTPRIQEEIHSVVWNNFESSPAAYVVFAALCLVLEKEPPTEGILDAPGSILVQLRKLDPDLSWLGPIEEGQLSRIQTFLDEFVNRQLVVGDRSSKQYRLRFPHHLQAILDSPEDTTQRALTRLKEVRRGLGEQLASVPGLLSAERAEQVALALHTPANELPGPAMFAGWHWPDALGDPSGGLVAQLGLVGREIVRAEDIDWRFSATWLKEEQLVILNAHSDEVKEVLDRRDRTLPPVLFCGGADLLRWSLQRDAQPDISYDFVEFGRLSPYELRWWFFRRRGLEFHDTDAFDLLWQLTSGIPLLVKTLDDLLRATDREPTTSPGLTVSVERLQSVKLRFTQALTGLAATLVSGSRALQLAPRERQLLRLFTMISKEFAYKEFSWNDVQEFFPLFSEVLPSFGEPPGSQDRIALQVLQLLGLLPSESARSSFNPFNRLVALRAGDAVFSLVEHMES
ncbi:hypothetical protein BVG81_003720 [Haliangium sp. UPWRP_2]|nr:hypothetical protein BVG81_003720 [Haliangium sp. UPWRP_2]